MKLNSNTILITGGTSGIGLALAQQLSDLGNTVIITSRSETKLNAAKANQPDLITHRVDVSDADSVRHLTAWLETTYPQLNLVINSAGIMRPYDLLDPTVQPEALTAEIQTNLVGTITVDQLLLPLLLRQPEAKVVNISSGLAYLSTAAHPIYSATKAGVHMFNDALRDQLAFAHQQQVSVMELVPPLVAETNLEPGAPIDAPNNLKLSDLVAAALSGIQDDAVRVTPGYAANMLQASQTAPFEAEHQLAMEMLPLYFPDGLIK